MLGEILSGFLVILYSIFVNRVLLTVPFLVGCRTKMLNHVNSLFSVFLLFISVFWVSFHSIEFNWV